MGRRSKRNSPAPLVVTVRWVLEALLLTLTEALGTAAPVGSVTVPTMLPLAVAWAKSRAEPRRTKEKRKSLRTVRMVPPKGFELTGDKERGSPAQSLEFFPVVGKRVLDCGMGQILTGC